MWLLLLCVVLFCACLFSFRLGQKNFIKSSKLLAKELDNFSAFILTASFIVGTAFLSAVKGLPIYTLNIFVGLLLAVFYFSQKKLTKLKKNLIYFALSLVAVLGLLLPQESFSFYYLFGCSFLALLWLIGWRLFCHFDKEPLVSYITATSWAFALFLVGMMIPVFGNVLGVFCAIIGVSVFAVLRSRLNLGVLNFGPFASEIIGFVFGGVWTLVILNTNPLLLILPYGYYLMEVCRTLIADVKKQNPETLFSVALKSEVRKKRAISVLFSHIFLLSVLAGVLSLLGFNVQKNNLVVLCLLVIVGFDLYNNLVNLERPVGTWKDMFSSIKEGIKQLPKGIKSALNTPKERLKKKKTTKKLKSKTKEKGRKK
ncbi:MAG: hypothetical protein E7021_01630 [Alphaproteobacteria bacterium]|nr:hypothetical protein [Alphaproteobacteria bacterium]